METVKLPRINSAGIIPIWEARILVRAEVWCVPKMCLRGPVHPWNGKQNSAHACKDIFL